MTPASVLSAQSVVDGYTARRQFVAAELAGVRTPRLLAAVLVDTAHVAEIPCGAGHFLSAYAAADVEVTLIDANPTMLAMAETRTLDVCHPASRIHLRRCYAQDLGRLPGVDLVVVPNAALGQLARQMPLVELLTSLRAALDPGTRLLAQVLCRHTDRGPDTSTFYDPLLPDERWWPDRRLRTPQGLVTRRRRQHRDRDVLRIDFEYHNRDHTRLHATTVELGLLSPAELTSALAAARFTDTRFLPGCDRGLSEVLATAAGGVR